MEIETEEAFEAWDRHPEYKKAKMLGKQYIFDLTLIALCSLSLAGCAAAPAEFKQVVPFLQVDAEFNHQWHKDAHPFTTAAVIDMNGDGLDEVFIGGGQGQADALLSFDGTRLNNMIDGIGLSDHHATYASASIDIDNDGDTDLLVGRANGLSVYVNNGGRFSRHAIEVDFAAGSVPLAITLSDIDHDGDADIYVSVFVDPVNFRSPVFNDPAHAKPNVLLLNEGSLRFRDITAHSGTAGKQNTFLSVFSDLDNDGWQDLLLAQNTGQIEIFRNNGDLTFTPIDRQSGFGFWMGIAVGDIDRDGDQDILFSNAGGSIPAFLTRGDLRDEQQHNLDWALWRNDGDFSFTEVTAQYAIDEEGFAWGAVFEDLNLDGRLDLLVAQNYIKWPLHKLFKLDGLTSLQSSSGHFAHIPQLNLENPYYGQSPLIVDINADSKPDVLWLNMDGPIRAFVNQTPRDPFTVKVPEQARYLGSRLTLVTDRDRSYTREVISGSGMSTDHSPDLVFALAAGEIPQRLEVVFPGEQKRTIEIMPNQRSIRLAH